MPIFIPCIPFKNYSLKFSPFEKILAIIMAHFFVCICMDGIKKNIRNKHLKKKLNQSSVNYWVKPIRTIEYMIHRCIMVFQSFCFTFYFQADKKKCTQFPQHANIRALVLQLEINSTDCRIYIFFYFNET